MDDLFGQPIIEEHKREPRQPNGYPRPPGSGPAGETCKTCRHAHRTGSGTHTFHKCEIIRFRWTCGMGTDILLRSPACAMWSPKA